MLASAPDCVAQQVMEAFFGRQTRERFPRTVADLYKAPKRTAPLFPVDFGF
jgi:hypothetical protein